MLLCEDFALVCDAMRSAERRVKGILVSCVRCGGKQACGGGGWLQTRARCVHFGAENTLEFVEDRAESQTNVRIRKW